MQEAVAVTTAIQEEIFLEMGIGKLVLHASIWILFLLLFFWTMINSSIPKMPVSLVIRIALEIEKEAICTSCRSEIKIFKTVDEF